MMNFLNDIIRQILLYCDIETISNFYLCCKNNSILCDNNFWIQKFEIEKLILPPRENITLFKDWCREFKLIKQFQSEATKLIKVALYNGYINGHDDISEISFSIKFKENAQNFLDKTNLINSAKKKMCVIHNFKLEVYYNKKHKKWEYKFYGCKRTLTTYNTILYMIIFVLFLEKVEILYLYSDPLIRQILQLKNDTEDDENFIFSNGVTLYHILDREEEYYSNNLQFDFRTQVKNNINNITGTMPVKNIQLETAESIKNIIREAAKIIKLPLYYEQYFERDENFDMANDDIQFSIWLKGNILGYLNQARSLCKYSDIICEAIKNGELDIEIHYSKHFKSWKLWCNSCKSFVSSPNIPWKVEYNEILYFMILAIYLENDIQVNISDYGYLSCPLIREVLNNTDFSLDRFSDYITLYHILDDEEQYYLDK